MVSKRELWQLVPVSLVVLTTTMFLSSYIGLAHGEAVPPIAENFIHPSETPKEKLQDIYVSLEFDGASIDEAMYFFGVISKRLDSEHKGVNFRVDPLAKKSSTPITLALYDVPLGQAVLLTCELANMKALVGKDVISIVSPRQVAASGQETITTYDGLPCNPELVRLQHTDFEQVELSAALQTLHRGTVHAAHDPDDDWGLSFVYFPRADMRYQVPQAALTVTIKRDDSSLRELLDEITRQTDTKYSIEGRVICVRP